MFTLSFRLLRRRPWPGPPGCGPRDGCLNCPRRKNATRRRSPLRLLRCGALSNQARGAVNLLVQGGKLFGHGGTSRRSSHLRQQAFNREQPMDDSPWSLALAFSGRQRSRVETKTPPRSIPLKKYMDERPRHRQGRACICHLTFSFHRRSQRFSNILRHIDGRVRRGISEKVPASSIRRPRGGKIALRGIGLRNVIDARDLVVETGSRSGLSSQG